MSSTERRQLPDDEVLAIIESAFQPLRCVAKIWDYDKKIKFRVFDALDQPIMKLEELNLELSRDESYLIGILEPVRERLEDHGQKLDPWRIVRTKSIK